MASEYTVQLETLGADELVAGLRQIEQDRRDQEGLGFACLVLDNGQSIFGRRLLRVGSSHIIVVWASRMVWSAIAVRSSRIASLFPIHAEARIGYRLQSHSSDAARANDLPRLRLPGPLFLLAWIPGKSPAVHRETNFTSYTPLYCDFQFFESITGGITGAGFGTPLLGVNLQWQKSIFGLMHDRVNKATIDLPIVLARSPIYEEVACRGYLKDIDDGDVAKMDGKDWNCAVIVGSKQDEDVEPDTHKKNTGLAAYVCPDSFLMPPETFVGSNCVFFGELYPADLKTKHGTFDRVLKVRAIASV